MVFFRTNGAQDALVPRTPAEIARQRLPRLLAARRGIAPEEGPGGDYDPGRTRAALDAAGGHETLQEVARGPFGDPFDRLDPPPLALKKGHQTGERGLAVDQHRAGAALPFPTPLLGAGQPEPLPQHVEEALHGMPLDLGGLAVDGKGKTHGRTSFSVGAPLCVRPASPSDAAPHPGRPHRAAPTGDEEASNNFSGVAGISATGIPVAFSTACTVAGAPPSIGSSPTPLAPKGPPPQARSSRWTSIRGLSLIVGMM